MNEIINLNNDDMRPKFSMKNNNKNNEILTIQNAINFWKPKWNEKKRIYR